MKKNKYSRRFSVKNFFLYLILIITLLLIIGTCDSNDMHNDKNLTENSPNEFTVGDIIQFSDTEWELLAAKDVGQTLISKNFLYQNLYSDEGKFIEISFRVRNISKKEIEFNLFIDRHHPKLYDSEEREYKYLDSMSAYLTNDALTTDALSSKTKIQPGFSRTFHAIYEVPLDSVGLEMSVHSVTDRTAKELRINLGLE